jgi:uncharacterized protein (TIGR03435 family)
MGKNDSRALLAVGILGRTSLSERIEVLLKRGRGFSPRVSPVRVGVSAAVLLTFAIAGSRAPRWIAYAQQPDRLSFEVASVKSGDPNNPQVLLSLQPGGRFTTINASLQMLIDFAYDVRNHQISGGPNWLDTAKFDIEAKAGGDAPLLPGPEVGSRLRLMVQSLLAERYKLTLHKETREEQVYELVVDKGGSKLKLTERSPDKDAADTAKAGPQGLRTAGRGQLEGMAAPASMLAKEFSRITGRSVIDRTGLAGRFDFHLKWTPDPGAPPPMAGLEAGSPPDPSWPSLFTAVQEELGLKLQSTKGPVEILVIDHVEKPDAN